MWKLSKEDQKRFERLCDLISDGMSLRKAAAEPDTPSVAAVQKWLVQDEQAGSGKLVARYARARALCAESLFDQIIDIASDEPDPNKARVKIDAVKWTLGKMHPEKYSDKQQIDMRLEARFSTMRAEDLEVEVRRLAARLGVKLPEKLIVPLTGAGEKETTG